MKKRNFKFITSLLIALSLPLSSYPAEPSGYYSDAEGKCGKSLLSSLNSKISSHTNVGYDGLWNVYKKSDVRADGTLWDIYSTKAWPGNFSKCGNYKKVGDCVNREHSLPKSWWGGGKSAQYSDAFHLYPTDGKVNGQRSNFPFGECKNGTALASNGSVKPLGKLGSCTFAGFSGTVFEPDDEYKGDLARSYFYMAACYNGIIGGWTSGNGNQFFAGNSFPVFKTWAINLLLKWHRQDPVSQKEIDRNEAIYGFQHNRNPFIDHPELAEHIWGDKSTVGWKAGGVAEPKIATPVSGTTINLGMTGKGVECSTGVTVKGTGLTADATVSVAGTGFSVSARTLSAAAINSAAGTPLKIAYSSSTTGKANGTLTISSGDARTSVSLTAEVVDGIPALQATEVGEDRFDANWVAVDPSGTVYDLHVECGGTAIAGYPKQVLSDDENWTVDGLTPGSTYTYYILCGSRSSNRVEVTTLVPVPTIQFLFDGELYFTAEPGQPSEVAEILMEAENIDGDITLSVDAPFELSTDKTNWNTAITLAPDEDRFYMRLKSSTEGTFSTELTATAGAYTNDDVTVDGTVSSSPTFFENFEKDGGSGYNTSGFSYEGAATTWYLKNAGVFGDSRDIHTGTHGLRTGKSSATDATAEMTQGKEHGAGIVTLWAKAWQGESGTVRLDYSADAGITWNEAARFEVGDKEWEQFKATVNTPGEVRIRLVRTSGGRIGIDDIEITDYTISAVGELEYHTWDAFCRNSALVIENFGGTADALVYGTDGITWFNDSVANGDTTITLPAGLYIVVINDFARRVLVK